MNDVFLSSLQSPCVKCGRLLHTGEGRVLIAFTPDELFNMAVEVIDPKVQARIVCALSLIDPERASMVDR
jgi:hypothetical protein